MGHPLCSTKEYSKYWFNWSCCGVITCIVIHCIFIVSNLMSIVYTYITIPIGIATPWKKTLCSICIEVLCFFSQWSHVQCIFSDPGSVPHDAVPLSTATEEEKLNMCVKCDQFKPPRAHHCSECGRCIVKMDHHCPWINNCVGIANMKFFLLFLIYTFLYCIFAIALCVTFFVHRLTVETESPYHLMLVTFICFLGLFFASFTISMLVESIGKLKTGETAIDTLKGLKFEGNLRSSLKEVFGGKGEFSLSWLLPIRPVLQDRADVLGYNHQMDAILLKSDEAWVIAYAVCSLIESSE